jgi:hypothetical protein
MAEEEAAARLQNQKGSVTAFKGHFSRQEHVFSETLAALTDSPNDETLMSDLRRAKRKAEDAFDKVEAAYLEIQILDPGDGKWKDLSEEAAGRMDTINRSFVRALAVITPDPKVDKAGKRSVKPESALKPTTLSMTMRSVEYRAWAVQWADYYEASNFQMAPLRTQIAHLRSCIDPELSDRVLLDTAADVAAAIRLVEARFMENHPLASRRTEYFRMKQAKNQRFSEHMHSLKQAAKEADVASMTPDDVEALRVLSSCTDKVLLEKMLDGKEKPSVTDLAEIVAKYEATKLTSDLMQTEGRAARAEARGPKDNKAIICYRCANSGHIARNCRVKKELLNCDICNVKFDHNTTERCKKRAGKTGKGPGEEPDDKKGPEKVRGRDKTPMRRRPAGGASDSGSDVSRDSSPARGRQVTVSCRQGGGSISVHPTPTLSLEVRHKASQRKEGFLISSVPDTGTTASVIKHSMAKKRGIVVTEDPNVILTDATGSRMAVEGTAHLYIPGSGGAICRVDAIVSSDLSDDFLLSWMDQVKLGILPAGWPRVGHFARRVDTIQDETVDRRAIPTGPESGRGIAAGTPGHSGGHKGPRPDMASHLGDQVAPNVGHRAAPAPEMWPDPRWPHEITQVLEQFCDVFDNKLNKDRRMTCPPMEVELKANAKPYQTTHTRPTPHHWKALAKKELQGMLDAGIVERWDGPSEWISPAHWVEKPSGGLRLVCDLSKGPNKAAKRPVHVFYTGRDIWQNIEPTSKFFFKADATQGYHQIPISKEARQYFCFLLPEGKFRYTVAPMGYTGAGDYFCQSTDRALRGAPVIKEMDDCLGQSETIEGLAKNLEIFLMRCRENGITLSKKKFEVGPSVKFAGFVIDAKEGCKPDPAKILAIKQTKRPESLTKLRSWLGACQQMACWWPDLSMATVRLRELTKKDVHWNWLPEHEEDFNKIKDMMSDTQNLSPFNSGWKTELITDASKEGLGFCLTQVNPVTERPTLVWSGSTSLTPGQKNYPAILLELLGVTWACQSCDFYLRGMEEFVVRSDHFPLEGVFNKEMRDLPKRLQPMRELCMPYSFTVKYLPGKKNAVADLLSREPIWSEEGAVLVNRCGQAVALEDFSEMVRSDPRLGEIMQAAKEDACYKEAVKACLDGMAKDDVKKLPRGHGARDYLHIWDRVGVLDRREDTILTVDGHRIAIPQRARKTILSLLHIPHSGITKTRRAASNRYYWVSMAEQVKVMCEACDACRSFNPSQPADPPLDPISKEAMEPMERIGLDLFTTGGVKYLVCVDRFSGYPLVSKLGRHSSTKQLIDILGGWFRDYGYSRSARHDDGPEFRDSFVAWLHQAGVKSEVSSAYNPNSNGLAEAGVKSVRRLIEKCHMAKESVEVALAEWRQAPREDGYSPADLFYLRHLRGLLPELPRAHLDVLAGTRARDQTQDRYTMERRTHAALPVLDVGQKVWLQDIKSKRWDIPGSIQAVRKSGRSYIVVTDDGGTYLRSRKYVKEAACQVLRVVMAVAECVRSAMKKVAGHTAGTTLSTSTRAAKSVRFRLPRRKSVSFQLVAPGL